MSDSSNDDAYWMAWDALTPDAQIAHIRTLYERKAVYLLSHTSSPRKMVIRSSSRDFSMVKIVTEEKPQKQKRRRLHQRSDDYRHFDPATGAMLNGGPGKPRPSRLLDEGDRKDYPFGSRIPNAIGAYLDGIMQQTGESKSALFSRILREWLKQQPDSPESSKLE